ncbi:hypothetical protein TNCV_2708741 [Trichonephila clavipes]|nr:hypothetical protein TNCV_2708741 [Trichonephila clavipes]
MEKKLKADGLSLIESRFVGKEVDVVCPDDRRTSIQMILNDPDLTNGSVRKNIPEELHASKMSARWAQ